MTDLKNPQESTKKSLGSLLGSLPELISRLIRGEIALAKTELSTKLKEVGVGAGLLVGAALFGFFLLAVLLIVTAVLALLGVKALKKGVPPTPEKTVASVKADVTALKGQGPNDSPPH